MLNTWRWWRSIFLVFAALWALRLVVPLPFLMEVLIFSIYAIGCSWMLGRVGFISFGQPAYLAVGAYGAAFYLYYWGGNPYLALAIGAVGGAVFSLVVGALFVRLRSDYFALANLALCAIVYYVFQKLLLPITQGDNGLLFLGNIDGTPVLNLTRSGDLFTFVVLLGAVVWAFYKFLDSTVFGACCLATKANETKLEFLGYDNYAIRLAAFVVANTTSALAGALYALYLGIVTPDMASTSRAADPIIVTILGGAGTLWGVLVGTIAYTGLRDGVSNFVGNWELVVGVVLVVVMLTNENGLWGVFERLTSRWKKRAA